MFFFLFEPARYKSSSWLPILLIHTLPILIKRCDAYTPLPANININLTLRFENSPFVAEHDVVVHRKVKLTIEPGCEIRFAKGRQLKVHGTLEARGTADRRIRFTKLDASDNKNNNNYNQDYNDTRSSQFEQTSAWKKSSNFRLVEGETITDGKLQIFFNSRWHYVCSTAYK